MRVFVGQGDRTRVGLEPNTGGHGAIVVRHRRVPGFPGQTRDGDQQVCRYHGRKMTPLS